MVTIEANFSYISRLVRIFHLCNFDEHFHLSDLDGFQNRGQHCFALCLCDLASRPRFCGKTNFVILCNRRLTHQTSSGAPSPIFVTISIFVLMNLLLSLTLTTFFWFFPPKCFPVFHFDPVTSNLQTQNSSKVANTQRHSPCKSRSHAKI